MRITAIIFVLAMLYWLVCDINQVCGTDAKCRVGMEAPQ